MKLLRKLLKNSAVNCDYQHMANRMAVRIIQEFPGKFIRQLNSLKLPQIKEMAK